MNVADLLSEETTAKYIKRLVKTLGIEKLGRGAYSTVFQHPVYHNVAVKLVGDDPEYMKFIRLCQQHQDNPWLPKIIGVSDVDFHSYEMEKKLRKTLLPTERQHIIFTQKLRPIKDKEHRKATKHFVNADGFTLAYNPYGGPVRYFNDIEDDGWYQIMKEHPDAKVREVARVLLSVSPHGSFDLHSGNLMVRDENGDAQVVFTDPVAS